MSLMDFKEVSAKVPFTGGEFQVYPLTVADVAEVLDVYRDDVIAVLASETRADVSPYTLLKQFPRLCRDLIVRASREVGELEDEGAVRAQVERLPFGVQLMALVSIWKLMAVDVEELGNVVRAAMAQMSSFERSLDQEPLSLPNGSERPSDKSES